MPPNRLAVRPYTPDAERIAEDIRRSSVVLMPSRSEGFGLVGLEALAFGVPILVSAESGLGELLRELASDVAHLYVAGVSADVEKDAGVWKEALNVLLSDRASSFDRALELRDRLRAALSWDTAVEGLLAKIEDVRRKGKGHHAGALAGGHPRSRNERPKATGS